MINPIVPTTQDNKLTYWELNPDNWDNHRFVHVPKGAVCYFILWRGSKIMKIGTTAYIVNRMRHYPGAWLFGVTEGYFQRDAELHETFSHLHAGDERFRLCDEIIEWMLYNTHQDVPADVWKSVHRFPRVIFNDLLGHDAAQYRLLREGSE